MKYWEVDIRLFTILKARPNKICNAEIRRIWTEYQLEPRTKFNTPVKKVTRAPMTSTNPEKYGHGRWMINETDGPYDAIIVNVCRSYDYNDLHSN